MKSIIKSVFEDTKKDVLDKLNSTLEDLEELTNKTFSNRICIGITGLSRSGKTTFITSFIHQLMLHDKAKLNGFRASSKIYGLKIHPLEDSSLTQFPYERALTCLSNEPPSWPESTTNISGCLLEIRYKSSSWHSFEKQSLFVELRDYPGEWLLDLPLMGMSFNEWSRQCLSLFTTEPRAGLLGNLFSELKTINPLDDYDHNVCESLTKKYTEFLLKCKTGKNSLSLIQPGRFLIPGEFENNEILLFFPLLSCGSFTSNQLNAAHKNSYYKVLERRYLQYVENIVKPFYTKFIKPINRQVILVDVINALHGGAPYLDDMSTALAQVKDAFSYGKVHPLFRLFNTSIDKLVIVATKADEVLIRDHDALRQLLDKVVQKANHTSAFEDIPSSIETIAAIRSSNEKDYKGEATLIGRDSDGTQIGSINPKIPDFYPKSKDFDTLNLENWGLPTFQPLNGQGLHINEPIPHIRMDIILDQLLGDKIK